ncbi:hypothetical protein SAMN05660657_05592 [Geodermatophilus amargosae]|uniref:DUF2218 domain-containing protein n=1 Tax=Geodermatophilus amargosae TaxID=1296565 RepID=A0A1I7DC24_9ACTN|nr:DUF2218 domain-containing protein [Geodermatophilus amargosae]SFU09134.1 hypothetical protein SAMN05660657_05592 [Geodermatophilus amargosae]
MTTLFSRADVRTDAPGRYAKQLVSHLGRKVPFTEDTDGAWTTVVGDARGRIVVGDDVLTLRVEAPDVETLNRIEHALGSHLERFGARSGLTVTWRRDHS